MINALWNSLTPEVATFCAFGLFVGLMALVRFSTPPPPRPPASEQAQGLRWWIETTARPFRRGSRGIVQFLPPSRANTTSFRFWLFRLCYAAVVFVAFAALYAIPAFLELAKALLEWLPGVTDPSAYDKYPPIVLAALLTVFPFGPFAGADESIRRQFYEWALIPARLRREINRLQRAAFEREDLDEEGRPREGGTAAQVRTNLVADGFDPADLVYDRTAPTARSMWMKASLLIEDMHAWQAHRRYSRAFDTLRGSDGVTRSVKIVETDYERLKDMAKACFESLRQNPETPEAEVCRDFRQECGALLRSIYSLLARVSLLSHLSDNERIRRMGELGFVLTPSSESPLPEFDEVVALALLLLGVVALPIGLTNLEIVKPLVIYSMVFITVLTPITIAHLRPGFAFRRSSTGIGVAFPVVVAGTVAVIHVVIAMLFMVEDGTIADRWLSWLRRGWPWTGFVATMAALIACRMRAGIDERCIPPLRTGWRKWGNPADGAWLAVPGFGVLALAFYLGVSGFDLPGEWPKMVIPPFIAFVVGSVVPTWYRMKLREERLSTEASQESEDPWDTPAPGQAAQAVS